MEFGTFSTLPVDFSPVETGIFGRLLLIPFHSYDGKRKILGISIVTVEKPHFPL
jgi:hypothetical protein